MCCLFYICWYLCPSNNTPKKKSYEFNFYYLFLNHYFDFQEQLQLLGILFVFFTRTHVLVFFICLLVHFERQIHFLHLLMFFFCFFSISTTKIVLKRNVLCFMSFVYLFFIMIIFLIWRNTNPFIKCENKVTQFYLCCQNY